MKRIVIGIASVIFLVLLLTSTANASLVLSVTVQYPTLSPLQSQTIVADTNECGYGVVFVVQPTSASVPWEDVLNDFPLPSPATYSLRNIWYMMKYRLPALKLTEILNAMNGKIVAFALANNLGGVTGHSELVFPDDFEGLNGVPSTAAPGTYKVIFIFKSEQGVDAGIVDFACGSWLVIPQVPLGTVMALLSSLCAIPAFRLYRKKHPA